MNSYFTTETQGTEITEVSRWCDANEGRDLLHVSRYGCGLSDKCPIDGEPGQSLFHPARS